MQPRPGAGKRQAAVGHAPAESPVRRSSWAQKASAWVAWKPTTEEPAAAGVPWSAHTKSIKRKPHGMRRQAGRQPAVALYFMSASSSRGGSRAQCCSDGVCTGHSGRLRQQLTRDVHLDGEGLGSAGHGGGGGAASGGGVGGGGGGGGGGGLGAEVLLIVKVVALLDLQRRQRGKQSGIGPI